VKKFQWGSEKISIPSEKISHREEKENRIENKYLEKEIYKEKEQPNLSDSSSVKRFVPPTIEEVKQYCLERKNNIDPEQFVAFYESKGWKVGNTPMKNWKACIITWEKKDKQKVTQTKYSKNNPPLDENGNIDLTCGGTFRGTIL
ncbi:MAG TPA: hypothetical protein PKV66_05570, partial [Candidatus Pelethenecus sp.]|nr:hypothetical protein [Candidatus Pelethenecus sp.]